MNIHADSYGEGQAPGYKYAHDYPGHFVEQQYLPDELLGRKFYNPGELGYEKKMGDYLEGLGRSQDN
jgi:putative ATPase